MADNSSSLVSCPKCHMESSSELSFCSTCGTPLKTVCAKCKNSIAWNTVFCPYCGVNISESKKIIDEFRQKQQEFLKEKKNEILEAKRSIATIDNKKISINNEYILKSDCSVRFRKETNSVISDLVLDRQWLVGPDEPTSFGEAFRWVASIPVPGEIWRLPSRKELNDLRSAGIHAGSWGPFQNSGVWIWEVGTFISRLTAGSRHHRVYFGPGTKPVVEMSINSKARVFAVRTIHNLCITE